MVLAVFGLSPVLAAGDNMQAPLVPDPKLSPGDVLTSDPYREYASPPGRAASMRPTTSSAWNSAAPVRSAP